MYVSLALALLLLVVMAWLILRPFLSVAPATAAAPPVVVPPKDLRRTPAAATAVAAAVASPTADAPAAPVPATQTASVDELRASVEAAVAARKAAMMRHSCRGCEAPVDPGDAFCRVCGTRVEEG